VKHYLKKFLPERWSPMTVCWAAFGCSLAAMVGWLFYRHPLPCILLMPAGLAFVPLMRSMADSRRKRLKMLEFSRMLQSLISALHAGHSLESAFREIERDMRRESWRSSNAVLDGLAKMNQRVALGEPIEKALMDAANSWELDDMKIFADTLAAFRRNGGNLLLHLRRTAELIISKMETEQDVQVILARKQTEAIMMNVAPYAMIALIVYGSPQYAEPLFTPPGRVVMSVALALNVIGHIWTYRMLGRNRL